MNMEQLPKDEPVSPEGEKKREMSSEEKEAFKMSLEIDISERRKIIEEMREELLGYLKSKKPTKQLEKELLEFRKETDELQEMLDIAREDDSKGFLKDPE